MGALPPGIARIVQRCLEKKPEARFRSAHDLAFALESHTGSSSASSSAAIRDAPVADRTRPWIAAVAAIAALALAAAGGVWYGRRASGAGAFQPPRFRQLTFDDVTIDAARFAPDGQTVVYQAQQGVGDERLQMTRLEFPGATPLPIPAARLFGVSSQAEILAGINPVRTGTLVETTLARVPLLGGAPRPVLDHVTFADWSPADDSIAVVHLVGSEQRLEFPIGHVLASTQGEITYPRVSPSGDRVAFCSWPVKGDDRGTVVVVDRNGRQQTISSAFEGVRGLAWTPSGDEVWYTATMTGTQYEVVGAAPGGKERRIYGAPAGLLLNDIAKDGHALLTQYDRSIKVEASVDGGAPLDVSWLSTSFGWDITADGSKVLLSYFGQGSSSNYDLYVRDVHAAQAQRVGEGQAEQFSPDGRSILSIVHGPPTRMAVYPIGAGEPRAVATGAVVPTMARWLPDGKRFLVIGAEPSHGVRAYVIDGKGGTPRAITPERVTVFAEQIAVSRDGRHLAARSPEGAVTIYPTDGGTPIPANGFAADELPMAWSGDQLLLLTNASPRQLIAVDPASGRRAVVRTMTPSDPSLIPGGVFFTADGRSYVANYQRRVMKLFVADGLR
jgi:eukaryotic-like serine/threonine-protein kinase